jgi:hypothetical protein
VSLAREHLQEIENLADSERQKEEEFVKITLGSMYTGNAHIHGRVTCTPLTYGGFLSAGSGAVGISRRSRTLTDTYKYVKTVAAITQLFLALVLYPQVQKRAQAELDAVVGRDRLPTFSDRPRLPYIEAICREVLRWQVVAPIG